METPREKDPKYAYVWFVMMNPQYVVGALVSAWSARKSGTPHDLVCLVTEDIASSQAYLKDLALVFGKNIFTIDSEPARLPSKGLSDKQKANYGAFFHKGVLRLQCLLLSQYEKVFLLDSDTTIISNCDNVFSLSAPAGVWGMFNVKQGSRDVDLTPSVNHIPYGGKVPERAVMTCLDGPFSVWETGLLLSPDEDDYDNIMDQKFQFPKNANSWESQALSLYYRNSWTQLTNIYNWIPWKTYPVPIKESDAKIIHFYSAKPWENDRKTYEDFEIWYQFFDELNDKFPSNNLSKYLGLWKGYGNKRGGEMEGNRK